MYVGVCDLLLTLQWHQNERDDVTDHRCLDFLPIRLYRRRSTKTPKLRVTGLYDWNPPVTGGFPSQRARNAENVSIEWRHHDLFEYSHTHTNICQKS